MLVTPPQRELTYLGKFGYLLQSGHVALRTLGFRGDIIAAGAPTAMFAIAIKKMHNMHNRDDNIFIILSRNAKEKGKGG